LHVAETSSKVSYFFDAEEVSGSNPLSPTLRLSAHQNNSKELGLRVSTLAWEADPRRTTDSTLSQ
jgi:hypothetical protein